MFWVSNLGFVLGASRTPFCSALRRNRRAREPRWHLRVVPAPDWTFEQCRESLNVSEAHLRALMRKKLVPFHRVGGCIRFEPHRIAAWKAAGGTDAANRHVKPGVAVPVPKPGRSSETSRPSEGHVGSSAAWLSLVPAACGRGDA